MNALKYIKLLRDIYLCVAIHSSINTAKVS